MLRRRRSGRRYEGPVARAEHPQHGWAHYAVNEKKNLPNLKRPLRWVDADPSNPHDVSGHWEHT